MKIDTPLTYTDFFGKTDFNLEECLGRISRIDIVKIALSIIHKKSIFENFKAFCEYFFNRDNADFVRAIYSRYHEISGTRTAEEIVINHDHIVASPHTGMELLRIAFSLPFVKATEYSDIELEQNLFYCLLAINETIIETTGDLDESLPGDIITSYAFLTNYLPYAGFDNTNNYKKVISQAIKTRSLCDFCHENPPYDQLLNLYLSSLGCDNKNEYLFTLIKLFTITDKAQDDYTTIALNPEDVNYLRDKAILTSLSLEISASVPLKDNQDYKVFRNYPLIKIDDITFVAISKTLCLDRIYNSILFAFKKINGTIGKPISNVLSDYASKFSEEFLFYGVLKNVFSYNDKLIELSGSECRAIHKGAEPDYYVRDWNNVFLFEYKDPLFNADTKTSLDINEVKQYLENKFIHKTEADQSSAIEQLVNNICRIRNNEFKWDTRIIGKKATIYPILVMGNPLFTSPGFAPIFKYYYKQELETRGLADAKIKDLVVIDIDTLVLYQNDFANKYIKLKDVIEDYYRYLKQQRPYANTPKNIMVNAFHYWFSLPHYIHETYPIRFHDDEIMKMIDDFKKAGMA